MTILNAAGIFALANDFNKLPVELPSGTVFVREMSARQKERYESFLSEQADQDSGNLRAALVVATVCDESGALQFTDADIDKIADLPIGVIDRLFTVALVINGMAKNAVDDAKKN